MKGNRQSSDKTLVVKMCALCGVRVARPGFLFLPLERGPWYPCCWVCAHLPKPEFDAAVDRFLASLVRQKTRKVFSSATLDTGGAH